jgi:hypothetical protein
VICGSSRRTAIRIEDMPVACATRSHEQLLYRMKRATVRSAMLLQSKLSEGDAMPGPFPPATAFDLDNSNVDVASSLRPALSW